MALNGIDVSNWQNGIDLSVVTADFVICKATEGTYYISPDCARQVEQAKGAGRLTGVYHYINGAGAEAEADFFLANIANWVGNTVLCADWEAGGNSAWGDLDYLRRFCQRIIDRTGVIPMVYASQSVFPWGTAEALNAGCWVAQYADNSITGYQDAPWNEGAYGCAIRQYSSSGRLDGYGGNLDLNKFYGDAGAWMKYACPVGATPEPAPTPVEPPASGGPQGNTVDLVAGVMRGDYGNGDDRSLALGSRYHKVQSVVNHILTADASTLADEVWAGEYGNGDLRKAVLGARYDEVMAVVNGGGTGTLYTVVSGDTLSGIAVRFGVTWQAIASANGIADANVIYPGQRLTIPSGGSTYTVVSGDTLSGIGAKLGVDWHAIAAKNGIASPYVIYPGQVLSV